MEIGPFREIRMKKTAPRGIKDDNDTRQLERHHLVHLGTFREIRMKKTAPRGIKNDNDTRQLELKVRKKTALAGNKDDKDRATWNLRMTMTRASWNDVFGQG